VLSGNNSTRKEDVGHNCLGPEEPLRVGITALQSPIDDHVFFLAVTGASLHYLVEFN
jgi:hypothetical protein